MLGANSSETVPAAWKLKGFWRLVRFIGRCFVFFVSQKFLFGNETFIPKVSFSALLEPSSDLRAFYTLEAPDVSVASWCAKRVRFQRRTARGLGLAIRSSCGAGSQNVGDDSSTCHFGWLPVDLKGVWKQKDVEVVERGVKKDVSRSLFCFFFRIGELIGWMMNPPLTTI